MNNTSNSFEIQNKKSTYSDVTLTLTLPPPYLFHSFGPGTFALNSHTYNPVFEKILDPTLIMNSNGRELQQVVH